MIRSPTSPPRPTTKPTPPIVYAYTFLPKNLYRARAHIIRELLELDFRNSTGYGANYYNRIDYGARENDVHAARTFLDPAKVGILGWSHADMITLMTIFQHPKDYAIAYAGVPVSDLVARLGYKSETYRKMFSANTHIGKTVDEDSRPAYLNPSPFTSPATSWTLYLVNSPPGQPPPAWRLAPATGRSLQIAMPPVAHAAHRLVNRPDLSNLNGLTASQPPAA